MIFIFYSPISKFFYSTLNVKETPSIKAFVYVNDPPVRSSSDNMSVTLKPISIELVSEVVTTGVSNDWIANCLVALDTELVYVSRVDLFNIQQNLTVSPFVAVTVSVAGAVTTPDELILHLLPPVEYAPDVSVNFPAAGTPSASSGS